MNAISTPVQSTQFGETSLRPTIEVRRQLTRKEKGQKLAQAVQHAYESGNKLYTKDMFREIEVFLAKHSWTEATYITLPSMIGINTKVAIPSLENDGPGEPQLVPFPVIYPYRKLMNLAQNAFEGETDEELVDPSIPEIKMAAFTCPIRISTVFTMISEIPHHQVEETWSFIEESWEQSSFRIELLDMLNLVDRIPKVSRVVCLGLGNLAKTLAEDNIYETVEPPSTLPGYRNYINHFVALTVAQVIGSRQANRLSPDTEPTHGQQSSLKVVAEDFSYSLQDKEVLAKAGFQILNGYGTSAFRVVDDETILVCCDPRRAVMEIIADIARPAAMLWIQDLPEVEQGDIQTEYWEFIKRKFSFKKYEDSPRTIQLLQEYTKYEVEVKAEVLRTDLYIRNT
ncbi:unnamed protein product [Clonostachys solani]|uniref:SRR1-like domain-containing protein n=1 Tax=Clonostachys solani TaxID=160281 RepID=A0A9N9VY65_9HYPO|nr:unnamed protein product [Clonostachys solani]